MNKFDIVDINTFRDFITSFEYTRPIKMIQLHHTWSPNYKNFENSNHLAILKGMENYHIHNSGFSEIAQNITTFPDGSLALCRDLNKIPAGIFGANTGGICIENLGNFDAGGDLMSEAQQNTIVLLVQALCLKSKLPINTDSIVYHHWFDMTTGKRTNGTGNVKTCPGTNFFGGNSVQNCIENFLPILVMPN